jgi:hypothetical protein
MMQTKMIRNFFLRWRSFLFCGFSPTDESITVKIMGWGRMSGKKKPIFGMNSRRMLALKMVPLSDVLCHWSPSKQTTPEPPRRSHLSRLPLQDKLSLNQFETAITRHNKPW